MRQMQNIHEPLINFQSKNGEIKKVHHMLVTDDSSGLRVACGVIDNYGKLQNSKLYYLKPDAQQNELVGVVLTIFDPRSDVILLGVLTPELNFHVISNDAFAARNLMVKTLFGTRATFNSQVDSLSFFEEWTDSPQIMRHFLFAVEELTPSCDGHWIK